MPKKVDLAGQRFGRWTVVAEAGRGSRGEKLWLCKCDCGAEKSVRGSSLTSMDSGSCGCLSGEITSKRKIDLTGKVFGRWTVLTEAGTKGARPSWLCRCDCGTEKVMTGSSLRGGYSRSCGCLAKDGAATRMRERGRDLKGKVFGRLTVIARDESGGNRGKSRWMCTCTCGEKTVVRGSSLEKGNTRSCGCYQREQTSILKKIWHSKKEMACAPITIKSKLYKQIPKCDNPSITQTGTVTVVCKLCGNRFVPTRCAVSSRVHGFSGKITGENNFYCSDKCKNSCSVFKVKTNRPDPRLRKPKSVTAKARACQSKALKQIQCDHNNGQSYCEKCQDLVDVELHHTIQVSVDPASSTNAASHMLLCAGCHVELHRECR